MRVHEFAKQLTAELGKEVKDLSGNTFVSFHNETTDLIPICRDQKDGNFYLVGLFASDRANKLMEALKGRR